MKNNEKILNNSYKNGDNLKGDDYEFDNKLVADEDYMSVYMKDTCDIDSSEYEKMSQEIDTFIQENEKYKQLTDTDDTKYTKEEINELFSLVYYHFLSNKDLKRFMRIAYMFDILCVTTNIKHSNMFDLLSFENKKIVINNLVGDSNEDITETMGFIF